MWKNYRAIDLRQALLFWGRLNGDKVCTGIDCHPADLADVKECAIYWVSLGAFTHKQ